MVASSSSSSSKNIKEKEKDIEIEIEMDEGEERREILLEASSSCLPLAIKELAPFVAIFDTQQQASSNT